VAAATAAAQERKEAFLAHLAESRRISGLVDDLRRSAELDTSSEEHVSEDAFDCDATTRFVASSNQNF